MQHDNELIRIQKLYILVRQSARPHLGYVNFGTARVHSEGHVDHASEVIWVLHRLPHAVPGIAIIAYEPHQQQQVRLQHVCLVEKAGHAFIVQSSLDQQEGRRQITSRQATQRPGKISEIRATLHMFPKSKSTQAPGHTRHEVLLLLSVLVVVHTAALMPVAMLAAGTSKPAILVVCAISTDQAQRVTVHGLWGVRTVLSGGHIRPCTKQFGRNTVGGCGYNNGEDIELVLGSVGSTWHSYNEITQKFRTHQRGFIWGKFPTRIINY